jgi:hypothetical protein
MDTVCPPNRIVGQNPKGVAGDARRRVRSPLRGVVPGLAEEAPGRVIQHSNAHPKMYSEHISQTGRT